MIPLHKVYMSPDVEHRVNQTLRSGTVTQGPRVQEFEEALRQYLTVEQVLAVNSCTSALQLAAYLAGVRPGSRVITTPMTCSATNTALVAMGAGLVWADVDPWTGNIDPGSVAERLKEYPDAVAVVCVDWAGNPCQLHGLKATCQEAGVKLIEDAAHAFGAEYDGKKIGHHGDFVCFSFQAIKPLTTVDGGALVCQDPADHERGKLLRWFGLDRDQPRTRQDMPEAGWKYHMNDLGASIGLANLPYIEREVLAKHRRNGRILDRILSDAVPTPTLHAGTYYTPRSPSYWVYTILPEDKEAVRKALTRAGVQAGEIHQRNDGLTAFRRFKRDLPGVDAFAARQISVPCGWWVSEEQAEMIGNTILEAV